MLFLLLICGYNFDYYDRNIYFKIITRIYCVGLVIISFTATLTCCGAQGISQIWSLIEYTFSVLIILCFKSQVRTFLHKLGDIDRKLRINFRHYRFEKFKAFVCTIIIWIIRIIFTYLYCYTYHCYNNFVIYLVSQFYLICLDANRVWRCILFDIFRYRLKLLRERLEEFPNYNFYLYVINNKTVKVEKLRSLLNIYSDIADSIELVTPELSASVLYLSNILQ